MALDNLDKRILYQLDQNSRATYKSLSSQLKTSQETISFRIKRLQKQGYIKNFLTTIHVSNLNRFYYKIYYKFHKTTKKEDKEIIEFIRNNKTTAYFASLEGKYDVAFLILARNMQDLYDFIIPFKEKFGDYILEQEILTMPEVHRFNFRFFQEKSKLIHTKYPKELKESKIDKIDYKIIKTLASNGRIKLINLAKELKTETNVIKYRIKKLKEKKILGSSVLDINFEKFDVLHLQVAFTLRNHDSIKRIISLAAQDQKTTFATVTLGKYDLSLEFAVNNMKELRNILDKIKEKYSQDIIDHDTFILEEHSINWFPYYI